MIQFDYNCKLVLNLSAMDCTCKYFDDDEDYRREAELFRGRTNQELLQIYFDNELYQDQCAEIHARYNCTTLECILSHGSQITIPRVYMTHFQFYAFAEYCRVVTKERDDFASEHNVLIPLTDFEPTYDAYGWLVIYQDEVNSNWPCEEHGTG